MCSFKKVLTNTTITINKKINKTIALGICQLVKSKKKCKDLLKQQSYCKLSNYSNFWGYKNKHYLFYLVGKKKSKFLFIIKFYDIADIII